MQAGRSNWTRIEVFRFKRTQFQILGKYIHPSRQSGFHKELSTLSLIFMLHRRTTVTFTRMNFKSLTQQNATWISFNKTVTQFTVSYQVTVHAWNSSQLFLSQRTSHVFNFNTTKRDSTKKNSNHLKQNLNVHSGVSHATFDHVSGDCLETGSQIGIAAERGWQGWVRTGGH